MNNENDRAYGSTYYIGKTTDTFADVLLAYGVAALLRRLLQANLGGRTVRVRDAGASYAIMLEDPIEKGFEQIPWFCDLPFLQTRSKRQPQGWPGEVVHYDEERERRAAYFEARKQLPAEARRRGATLDDYPALAALIGLEPRSDWDILAQINQMQGISAYSQVLTNWYACRTAFPDLLRLLLGLFADVPNDADTALADWRALKRERKLKARDSVTPVQILNPGMGKGINRTKADGAHRVGNPDSFWALEFLKFWGMRIAGVPRIVRNARPSGGRGPRDRKTYVLRPMNVTLDTMERVYRAFDEGMWANTAVKMDVLAVLRFTRTFLDQWLAGQLVDVRWGEEPGDYVRGLAVAFYKDLGSAVALLNLAELGVPSWMRVTTPEQGRAYRGMIEEHQRVVSSLNEGRAEEYRLLQQYRDLMSARDLDAFFGFAAGYATLTMTRIARGQWAPRFAVDDLEVLVMQYEQELTPILQSPGFRSVAAAIRRSTVIPQYFKARGNRGPYEIRYGLSAHLLRQATYPDQFVQALSAFLQDYNRETAQVYERYKSSPPIRRAAVTTQDIEQVISLIDRYGSKTVASLLVAFGYARQPRDEGTDSEEISLEEEEESEE